MTEESDTPATGWLNGWQYRKMHNIVGATGAGTNYQIPITVYYNQTIVTAQNAPSASISTAGYLAENIAYDNVTGKYWWVFADRTGSSPAIGLAYATSLSGSWTVQGDIISQSGRILDSPCLVQFGSYWYIYYANGTSFENLQIWAERSTSVNSGYSKSGIINPILTAGSSGTWDSLRVLEPFVFQSGNTYYLFYCGQNGASSTATNAIEKTGYATSSSPTSGFTKYSGNPVLPTGSHGWDIGGDEAADTWVIQYNSVYYVGVTGCVTGHNGPWMTGLYTTTNFQSYTYYGQLLQPSMYASNWDSSGSFRGGALYFNGVYYLSYTGVDGSGNYRMGLATLAFGDSANSVSANAHCRTDFRDVRFVKSDGSTVLNYWMQTEVNSKYATFWVQDPDNLTASSSTIYLYYGNSGASYIGNGGNVFTFFDNYTADSSIDWTNTYQSTSQSSYTLSGGLLHCAAVSAGSQFLFVKKSSFNGYSVQALAKAPSTSSDSYFFLEPTLGTYTGYDRDELNWASPSQQQFAIFTNSSTHFTSYYPPDTSNFFNLIFNCPLSGYAIGNIRYGNMTNLFWGSGVPASRTGYVGMGDYSAGELDFNWLFVRKYVYPEPSQGSWGSEELGYAYMHSVHLLLTVEPNQATYVRGQAVTFTVNVFNQLNPAFESTLTLTVTGSGGYYYFDFQTISVAADAVSEFSFSWAVPGVAGTYVVEVSLVPPQLTAYDAVWLEAA